MHAPVKLFFIYGIISMSKPKDHMSSGGDHAHTDYPCLGSYRSDASMHSRGM